MPVAGGAPDSVFSPNYEQEGRNVSPLFSSLGSGRVPSRLRGETEAFLAEALEQGGGAVEGGG